MSLILNIDTASESSFVNIAKDGVILQAASNASQKDHASFLQPAIQKVMSAAGINLQEIDAVAVNYGPGSYTGLRVGMASAKGLCYALKKPLIVLNGLEILAKAAGIATVDLPAPEPVLFCPMIDARRMEVFTGMYDKAQKEVFQPCAMILEENSFKNFLANYRVFFAGSGAAKWKVVCSQSNAVFITDLDNDLAMNILSLEKFIKKDFSDLVYTEPLYLKEFYNGQITS